MREERISLRKKRIKACIIMGRLNFVKNIESGNWECEAGTVSGPFAINICTEKKTYVNVMVKDAEAPDYDYVRGLPEMIGTGYFAQMTGEVWPLKVKIVCGLEPTFAKLIEA